MRRWCVKPSNQLPASLTKHGKFVCYKLKPVKGKKDAKVPYNPRTGKLASHTDPASWSDYATCAAAVKTKKYDGINLVCEPRFTCVDLDKCVVDGEPNAAATELVAGFPPSYWELSPSGTGLRGIFETSGIKAIKNGWMEAYSEKHFMSVTGNAITSKPIAKAPATTFDVMRKSEVERATPDAQDKLSALLRGEDAGIGDDSAADASLCSQLARKGLSREQVELVWQNARPRKKLERDDYRRSVLDFAFKDIKTAQKAYDGDGSDWKDSFPAVSEFDGDEFPERYIVQDIIGYQQVTAISGAPESKKTMGVLALAAGVADGKKVYDHFPVREKVDGFLYCIPEMSRAGFVRFARYFGLNKTKGWFRHRSPKDGYTIPLDDPRLQQAVKGRVLVLDTLLYFFAGEDSYKATDWLAFSSECRRLIDEFGCAAIILLIHPTKSGASDPELEFLKLISQSIALAGLIDAAFVFHRSDDYRVLVKCLKGREWEKRPKPFVLSSHDEKGESYISKGRFPCTGKPGTVEAKDYTKGKTGRKADPAKIEWIPIAMDYEKQRMSYEKISEKLNEQGFKTSKPGVYKALMAIKVKGQVTNDKEK
jgi:hypothetical protein